MVDTGSVPSAYLSIAFLAIVGILMPLTNFIMSWALRPRTDPSRPHITRSYLLKDTSEITASTLAVSRPSNVEASQSVTQ